MSDVKVFLPRDGLDWAEIHVRPFPSGVSVLAASSFGTYANVWTAIGDGDALDWLRDTEFDYFMTKCAPNRGRVFDPEGSAAEVRRRLMETRREGALSKAGARKALEDLDAIGTPLDETAWFFEAMRSSVVDLVYSGDMTDFPCLYRRDPMAAGFWRLWQIALAENVTSINQV